MMVAQSRRRGCGLRRHQKGREELQEGSPEGPTQSRGRDPGPLDLSGAWRCLVRL